MRGTAARSAEWRGIIVLLAACLLALGAAGCGGAQTGVESATSGGEGGGGASGDEGGDGQASGAGGVVFSARGPSDPWVTSAAFSGDGRQLFFATADGAVWELDVSGGAVEPRRTLEGGALHLVHGGTLMLQTAPVVRVVGVRDGLELLRLPDWSSSGQIAASHSGEHLLVGQGEKLGRWNLPRQAVASVSGERVEEFINRQLAESVITLPAPATALSVGDSSAFVVAFDDGGKQGTLRIWRPEQPDTLKTVGRTNGTVQLLSLSPDEQRVVAINSDGALVVAPTTKQAFERWAVGKTARHAEWLDDGTLVVHESDGVSRAYDPASGTVKWELAPPRPLTGCWSSGTRLACSDGQALLLVGGADGEIIGWVGALDGQALLTLPDGSHVGTGPASWVTQADGSSFDTATWSSLESSARVLRALQGW